jgi:hypothetical protein
MRFVLETDAALAARLDKLVVEVPGLTTAPQPDRPLIAFGVGADTNRLLRLLIDGADRLARLAGPCGSPEVVAAMSRTRAALAEPMPAVVEKIRGFLFSAQDATLGPDGKPTELELYAIVASADPAGLYALARQQWPAGQVHDLVADGQFHDLGPPVPLEVRAAIKPTALVVAIGTGMADAAERAIARVGPSPLMYAACDYSRLVAEMPVRSGSWPSPRERIIWSRFGMMSMWLYPTDLGLAFAFSAELK